MESLVQRLGPDRPSIFDRFAREKGALAAKQRALERISSLSRGGCFRSVSLSDWNKSAGWTLGVCARSIRSCRTKNWTEARC